MSRRHRQVAVHVAAERAAGYPMPVRTVGTDPESDSGLKAVALSNRVALLRFIRARGATADAEDVFQDLWLKLSTSPPAGPIAEPLGYLYRVADNMMHDRRRAAGRRERRESDWSDHDRATGADSEPSAERLLAAREELVEIERMLAQLGDRTDHIFRRFRLDGATQKAIAAETGISLSAVEKHLQRAYRAIAEWRLANGMQASDAGSGDRQRLGQEDR